MRRSRSSVLILLVLILLSLLLLTWLNQPPTDLLNRLPGMQPETIPTEPSATIIPSPTATDSPQPSQRVLPSPTARGPATPADEWANALLDQLPDLFEDMPGQTNELVWWQREEAQGELAFTDGAVQLNGQAPDLGKYSTITISVPQKTNPDQLASIAGINLLDGALSLALTDLSGGGSEMHWLVSNTAPAQAFQALVSQAEHRQIKLTAAFAPVTEDEANFVLVGIALSQPTPETPTASGSPPLPSIPSRTPTQTATATATRQPDVYLGRLMAEKIDPVIDIAGQFTPNAVYDIISQHPWVGLLTWTEEGALIGLRPTAIQQAEELSFYSLIPDTVNGATTHIFSAYYAESTTRLPDDQVYFQGQRMEEMLYWLVTQAARRGGQLYVAYDDFGIKQTVIIVGFREFPAPTFPASPTP